MSGRGSKSSLLIVAYLFLFSATFPTGSLAKFCTPTVATRQQQQDLFHQFIRAFYIDIDIEGAYSKYVQENYIQHNPFVKSGAAEAVKSLKDLEYGKAKVTLLHTAFDQGYGWVHFKGDGSKIFPTESAVLDIFRYNGSCIGEHWDVIEEMPSNATNPLALFDNQPVWL